uniref:Secreted protein n=1 Tax=Caenorhabditis tropicalis TaxID=1561998 RepID=A0A1I7TI10_9PELO
MELWSYIIWRFLPIPVVYCNWVNYSLCLFVIQLLAVHSHFKPTVIWKHWKFILFSPSISIELEKQQVQKYDSSVPVKAIERHFHLTGQSVPDRAYSDTGIRFSCRQSCLEKYLHGHRGHFHPAYVEEPDQFFWTRDRCTG